MEDDENVKWLREHGFFRLDASWRLVKDGIIIDAWKSVFQTHWIAVLKDGHVCVDAESEDARGAVRSAAGMAVKEMDGKIDALACARGRLVNVMLEADRKEDALKEEAEENE